MAGPHWYYQGRPVCDAVIKDPVYIPFNNEKGFLLSHNEEGKLQSLSVFEDELDDDVFGAGDDPLDHPSLDSSGLNDLNSETAQKFSQAVLLAMYGLSPFLNRDKESSFEIPKALTPKRNVVTKSLCAALAIFLLMLGIFHASRIMALKKNEAAKIDARISSLKKEARMNMVDANTLEDLTVLHEEMMTKIERPTSAKAILVVLTETLPEDFHLTSFSVRNERISCKVRVKESSDKGSEDLYNIFKKEDFFDKDIEVSDGSRGEINLALKVAKVVNHENLENN